MLLWNICNDCVGAGCFFQSDEDFQETRREVENLMKKNADWIWDWSSRPENNPPKYVTTTNLVTLKYLMRLTEFLFYIVP